MAVPTSAEALPLALHLQATGGRNFLGPGGTKKWDPLSVSSGLISCPETVFIAPHQSTDCRLRPSSANCCCLRSSNRHYARTLRKHQPVKALFLGQVVVKDRDLQIPVFNPYYWAKQELETGTLEARVNNRDLKRTKPHVYGALSSQTGQFPTSFSQTGQFPASFSPTGQFPSSLLLCRSYFSKGLSSCDPWKKLKVFFTGPYSLTSRLGRRHVGFRRHLLYGTRHVGFQRHLLYASLGDSAPAGSGDDTVPVRLDDVASPLPEEDLRDDDVLPESLEGAVLQSSQAVAEVFSAGGQRALVEYLIPELESFEEDGAQIQLWELSRLFLNALQMCLGVQHLRAIFPDAGSAALLSYRWKERASFQISSLNDRMPVSDDDEVVVMIAPDYQLLDIVMKIAASLNDSGEDGGAQSKLKPLVIWNAQLTSGDIGLGLTARRMRDEFLGSFATAYSMRPLPVGCVFRCYPRPWQVFIDDSEAPGRYVLLEEQNSKPEPDDLDTIFMTAMQGGGSEKNVAPSAATQAMGLLASLQRFMRALSR